MRKRYLVVQAIDHEFEEVGGFVLTAKPGQEVEIDDEMAKAVNQRFPGALREMDAKTKRDWAPDEDLS